MDALEKERLRRKMAITMEAFQGQGGDVVCVSGHWSAEPHRCDLCGAIHAHEILVIKNRKGRTMKVDSKCLAEMIKFHVADVQDLTRWLTKLKELRVESAKREEEAARQRAEERRRLERRVIVRRRSPEQQ